MLRKIWMLLSLAGGLQGAVEPYNTEQSEQPPTSPGEAIARIRMPEGFHATLFAHEPQVRQPIGMTFDSKGRLWVAENHTYAENRIRFADDLRDRIVILEDQDRDGVADTRKVFWDDGVKLTSMEPGYGGVWAMCAPQLLFIPDRDGDDVPDGEPEVILDGFEADRIHHNIANGLKWGPDGWLYGRHGIQAVSWVGAPGTPKEKRLRIDCSIWRYHPRRKVFERVVGGTTNPWGHDWNEYGELFFINTVIGHLWHAVPGAWFKRMYGEHENPYLYELIDQSADHLHWAGGEKWQDVQQGMSALTSEMGGGHAHCGFMIYLGNNWPARFRGEAFTLNLHGRRINHDHLQRRGAGYVGTHQPDLIRFEDPWFRGIELLYGPDGGVFVADWSDVGECHESTGVHRTSGRIYKIVYGEPDRNHPLARVKDLTELSSVELARLQENDNEWFVRQARRILHERHLAGADSDEALAQLQRMYAEAPSIPHRLRALWCLHLLDATPEDWLIRQLKNQDEHIRAWAVRLLIDQADPSAAAVAAMVKLARDQPSGLVRLYLAAALQRLGGADRWPLAEALVSDARFADDPVLPKMVWYGIEPVVPESRKTALAFAAKCRMPLVRTLIARRLAATTAN